MANRAKAKNMETGRRIRELRVKNGYTQKDLAEKLNVSDKTLSRLRMHQVH